MELDSNCSFQDFEEGKVGDWSVVNDVLRVQTGLFENGGMAAVLKLEGSLPDS